MTAGVVVTGLGIVSALGWSPEETWRGIKAGRSGLSQLSLFDSPRNGRPAVGAVCGDLEVRSGLTEGSRSDHLAAFAAGQAFKDAGLDAVTDREDIGVLIGGCVGGMLLSEEFVADYMKSGQVNLSKVLHHECASAADMIAERLGCFGPCSTVSTACASGSNAISCACELIEAGAARMMLAGGADSLCRLTVNGFSSLLLVDPDGCRPFDENRQGMSLGEGAAVLVLESLESAENRGADIYARVSGWSNTCDAHHNTAPAPDGAGARRAISIALQRAGLNSEDIDYVNAHGTGTPGNDLAEANGLRELFGENLPAVSSTKRFFGHTFAAAGAIEALLCILALKHQALPANLGLSQADPACGINPVPEFTEAEINNAMSLSLGFGGNNGCLILSGDNHVA
jgi:3-oxoacyl-(acyl-carrier-protein) synthase